MDTITIPKDIEGDGVVYLKAGKEYKVKSKEESKDNKIKVILESEIKGIGLLIEIDKKILMKTKASDISGS